MSLAPGRLPRHTAAEPHHATTVAPKHIQPEPTMAPAWSLLATTSRHGTTHSTQLADHPRRAEAEAHEAVHRDQFALAGSAPRGSRDQLEREATIGARDRLQGRAYTPLLAAADDLVLAFSHSSAGQHLERFKAWLVQNTRFDVDAVDWDRMIVDLLGSPRVAPLIDASETAMKSAVRDRYRLEVEIFDQERAGGLAAPAPATSAFQMPSLVQVEDELFLRYVPSLDPTDFAADDVEAVSTAFVGRYLDDIGGLTIVPATFRMDDLAPTPRDADLETERQRVLGEWVRHEMKDLAFRFLLDDFASAVGGPNAKVSGLPPLLGGGQQRSLTPEDWLKTLDLVAYKDRLVAAMTTVAVKRLGADPVHQALLRTAADEQSRFKSLQSMHTVITGIDRTRGEVIHNLRTQTVSQWDVNEIGVWSGPAAAFHQYEAVAAATSAFYARLARGRDNDVEMLKAAAALATALGATPQTGQFLAELARLGTMLTSYRGQLEASHRAVEQRLRNEISINYGDIAIGIKQMGDFASDYLTNTFIPKMHEIALTRITANVTVLQARRQNWATYSAQTAKKLEDLAARISDLAEGLRNGSYDRIVFQGQTVSRRELKLLADQVTILREEATALRKPPDTSKRYAKLVEAIDGFSDVRDRIKSGKIEPNRYGADVLNAARKELRLDQFPEWTTYGDIVFGRATAAENPFLARLVIGWKVVEDLDDGLKGIVLFAGLGLVTIASLLTGGLAAAFLAPGASAAVGVVLFAVDATIGIGLGLHEKNEAKAFLQLVRLDIGHDITGVSEEDAERALTLAWFGLVLSVALVAGSVAVMAAVRLFRSTGESLQLSLRYFQLAREDPQLFASLRKIVIDPVKLDGLLGVAGDAKNLESLLHRMHGPLDMPMIERLLAGAGDAGVAIRVLDKVGDAKAADSAMTSLVRQVPQQAARTALLDAGGLDVVSVVSILERTADLKQAHRLMVIVPDGARLAEILRMSSRAQLSDDTLRSLGRLEPHALRLLTTSSPHDIAEVLVLVDRDPAAMNALFASRGPAVLRGVQTAPYETPSALAKALDRAATRLGPQPGYTTMTTPKLMSKGELVPASPGWVGTATKDESSFGTKVTSPTGRKLKLKLRWAPDRGELSLDTAFASPDIEAVADGPKLVPAGAAKAAGQPGGSPAAVYFTLQDMRIAKVPYGAPGGAGGVRTVRLHQIQNADTLAHLHWLRERYPNIPLKDLVRETSIYRYGETITNQSGYKVVAVDVDRTVVETYTARELTKGHAHGERAALRGMTPDQVRAEYEQTFQRYGVAADTALEADFDIVLTVQPW